MKKLDEGNGTSELIRIKMTRKVDFNIFVWVISILSGTMIVVSGYLFSEITHLRAAQEKTVTLIDGYMREANAKIESGRDARQIMREMIVELRTEMNTMKDRELRTR